MAGITVSARGINVTRGTEDLPHSVASGSSSDTAGRSQILTLGSGGRAQLADFPALLDYAPNVGRGYVAPVYPLIAGGTAAVGDGNGHTLADVYATLAAAQVDYPAATSLTQTVDWAVWQHAGDQVSASKQSGLFVAAPPASWRINSTITWQPPSGASFRMDLIVQAGNNGGMIWTGGSNTSVIRTLGLRYSHWQGLWVQATNATGVTLVDFDGDSTRTFAGPMTVSDFDVRFPGGTNCIGIRLCHNPDGGMTGGGGFDFDRVYSISTLTGATTSTGLSIEYNNNLTNSFRKCSFGGPGCVGVTNIPSSGAGGPAVGSRSNYFYDCESSNGNNASSIDFQIKTTTGTHPQGWVVIGGRFENGNTFAQITSDGAADVGKVDLTVIGAQLEGYTSAATVISASCSATIELVNCSASGTAGVQFGSGMISLLSLPTGNVGALLVRGGSLSASSPFWTAGGNAGGGASGVAGGGWTVDVQNVTQLGSATGLKDVGSVLGTPHYAIFTANGTFIVPMGVTKLRVRAVGGGGGGGGGGSAAATQLQTGGSGAPAGLVVDQEFSVNPGDTITVTVGAGGTSGSGGAAAGAAGTNGGAGTTTNITNTTQGVQLIAATGGVGGLLSGASATAAVGAPIYGAPTAAFNNTGGNLQGPGSGGPSALGSNRPFVCVVGGAGGGTATATNGGGGGAAQTTALLANQAAGGSGASGTAAGVNGTTATQPGCGGGGGGGGAAGTGAGGNGGAGAPGQAEIWW